MLQCVCVHSSTSQCLVSSRGRAQLLLISKSVPGLYWRLGGDGEGLGDGGGQGHNGDDGNGYIHTYKQQNTCVQPQVWVQTKQKCYKQ